MSVKTEIAGIVDGIDFSGTVPMLQVGSVRVPIDGVKSMKLASRV
jgi:flagellar basal-body rod modification protein FlgD